MVVWKEETACKHSHVASSKRVLKADNPSHITNEYFLPSRQCAGFCVLPPAV